LKIETKGVITFVDNKNDLKATIELNKVKKKPSDFFKGEISSLD